MRIILLLCIFLNASSSMAALVERPWENGESGNTYLTYDAESGLEWLDVDINVAVSVTSMEQQLSNNVIYSGFRYATQPEVQALFTSAGLSEHSICYFCPDGSVLLEFFGYLGLSFDWTDTSLKSKGVNAFVSESNYVGNRYMSGIQFDAGGDGDPWTAVLSHYTAASPTSSIQNVSHFLVREAVVPLPGAFWLFASGLGIILARFKRA